MTSGPPRAAVWLLSARLSGAWRDFVLGDLEEEFSVRSVTCAAAARRWFWWQTIRCLFAPPHLAVEGSRHSPQGDSMIRTLMADVRYGGRVLMRAPSFTVAVVAVLALGIGANTAIFTIVNTVLLRPLPFEQPDRLVRLFHVPPQDAFPGVPRFSVAPANYYDWKRDARGFEGMALYRSRQFTLTGLGEAQPVRAGAVEPDLFHLLNASPALGRVFLPEENVPGRAHVVMLSYGFWRSHFGASPAAVGGTLQLDGEGYSIVGVMPARFSVASWGLTASQIWVPVALSDADRAVRDNHNDQVIARLKSGTELAQAQAEMDAISTRLERDFPQTNAGWGATVVPLQDLIVTSDLKTTLMMLLTAVGLVLLIACANVGNLLFARALGRGKEIAIRAALGAGRRRVFQQLLIESLLLSIAGGVAGLALARVSLHAAAALLADQIPRADEISMDMRVLLFAAGVSILTGILAGALPALRAGRTDLTGALKEGGRQESTVGTRMRRALIVSEVALSLVLLMGAGVMIRTVSALRHVDAGFDPHDVLTLQVSLPEAKYRGSADKTAFFDAVLSRMRALPGVRSAGAIDDLPTIGGSVQPVVLEGQAERLPRDQPTVAVRKITPGYLRSMNVPLVRGSDLRDGDVNVLLVSRSAAALLWGTSDPVGRRVTLPLESKTLAKRVIGIVGDVKQEALDRASMPTVYEYSRDTGYSNLTFVLRTSVPPLTLAQAATAAVHAIDADQPVEDVQTMEDVLDRTLTSQRFAALLLGLFAALALLLASIGIYSVLSYIVSGRSREIGIRTALGAGTGDVVRLVVREGMTPALIGIAAGVTAALGSAPLISKLVFGVSASDPVTLAVVSGTLATIALLASMVPAYRASRVDPLTVLRG